MKELDELRLQLQAILALTEYLCEKREGYPGSRERFRTLYQSFYEDAKRELEAAKKHAGET